MPAEHQTAQQLTRWFQHCGSEFNARKRKALRRDSFPQFMQKLTPSAPLWRPRTVRLGRLLFAATRAITGEWAVAGKVRRLHYQRGRNGYGAHLIVGPWCLSVGTVR